MAPMSTLPLASATRGRDRSDLVATSAVRLRVQAAVKRLDVTKETRSGFNRDEFNLWVDADGDCFDTRAEVLQQESLAGWTASDCTVVSGKWHSYYDGQIWRRASNVDIDHLVPLAEAWDSGARKWNADTRERYANDLGDRRTLVAVTDNVNQAKGDQDITEWLPDHGVCRYLREWTVVKTRWSLTVNRSEKRQLRQLAGDCPNRVLHIRLARVTSSSSGGGGGAEQPLGRMHISKVVYDPPGADAENAETITLVNRGRNAQLQGFRLRDGASASYRLPSYRIGRGHKVIVHSGHGNDRRGHLYAGWGFTWNNDGDTARRIAPKGRTVGRCSWGDGSGTVYY